MTYPPPQPPPGQQDAYGQQLGHYRQSWQYGQPPNKKTGMIVAIVVVAVLVLAGAGVGIVLLATDDGESSSASAGTSSQTTEPDRPTERPTGRQTAEKPAKTTGRGSVGSTEDLLTVAQHYADAINVADETAATKLTCTKDGPGTLYKVTNSGGQTPGDILVGNPRLRDRPMGTEGIVDVTLVGRPPEDSIEMPFDYKDGKWCVKY